MLAVFRRLHKKSIKDASQYSFRLSETSLYKNTDLGCISHVQPTLGGPRLIAWSQPSSHGQHAQHRRSQTHPTCSFCTSHHTLGAALCRRFAAPSPSAVDATLEAALCSWGDKGLAPTPRRRRATPQKDLSDYVLKNGGEDARRINSCL